MLHINGNNIQLTRGDTAYLTVPIKTETNTEYVMQAGDKITLSVKKNKDDTEYIFQKVVTGSNRIHIEQSDTSSHPFGKYKYDVQIDTADGDTFTVIESSTFELLEEITC